MKSDTLTDAELIRQCVSGSEKAWEALISRYERLIYYAALRAGASHDQLPDIFQGVCVTWLQELGRLRDPERLGAWLVTTTRRACWASWRSDQKKQGASEAMASGAVSSADSPEVLAGAAEDAIAVRNAIQALPDPCRRLLGLLYFQPDRPSYAEVAKSLKVSVNSIGPMRVRCLEKLREALKSEGW
jgi:RNA polymerase sigma factor (sigma-70 family)